MARQARELSDSGYMHVIVRGTDRQPLFATEEDYAFYLASLDRYSLVLRVTVCAWCLMENHAHLLLYDTGKQIPTLMKKLGVRYSRYFNQKYDRTGHLFQDRYRSEKVEDDAYLATVFRYILRNPEKAGICKASEYRWSSYALYGNRESLADTGALEKIIGDQGAYETWIAEENDDECLEYMPPKHDDDWALKVIHKQLGGISGAALRDMDREVRNGALRKLKKAGLSVRQIERLTGINRGTIQKA
ncbi:MAG: transposase [Clostridia bacterium]|nr:transposase [Clostridia bacterium]